MSKPKEYNWKGSGPSGCDSHCIPHPCGPCATEKGSKLYYERDFYRDVVEEQATLIRELVGALEYIGEALSKAKAAGYE